MRYKGYCGGHLSIDSNGMCCELEYEIHIDFSNTAKYLAALLDIKKSTITLPIGHLSLKNESCRRCLLDGFERAYTQTQKRHTLPKKRSVHRNKKTNAI